MKRIKLILPILVLMLLLTGCIQEYKLSEKESDATAEYMAGLLLKYDDNYEQDLIPKDEIEVIEEQDVQEDVKEVTPTVALPMNEKNSNEETSNEANQKPAKKYTLSEVINEKDLEIKYSGYDLVNSYPEDLDSTYFSVTPRKGYQLLVINFDLTNKSKKDKKLNLSKTDIIYQLDINVGTIYEPSFTLLENDLHYIDITVEKEKTIPVILIYEISKDTEIKDANLIVTRDNRSDIIEIK